MKVVQPKTSEEFEKYYDLRWRILRKPWNQPKGSEKDGLEDKSINVMACEKDNLPLGIGRLHFNSPEEGQIRYMAVEEGFQGKGIGKKVLGKLERIAKEKGAKYISLNARENAVGFYEKLGYEIYEKGQLLYGKIQHFKMKKNL